MNVVIGVDVGQQRDRSALCVVERDERPLWGDRTELHFIVRHLERLRPAAPVPELVRRLSEVVARVRRREESFPSVGINATGLGEPIIEPFREALSRVTITSCYFNHGDRIAKEDYHTLRVGKSYLVSQLKIHLQYARLHLPRTPEAEVLARELLDFEVHIEPDANERYGAFRVGTQDDLVTALGLALVANPPPGGVGLW